MVTSELDPVEPSAAARPDSSSGPPPRPADAVAPETRVEAWTASLQPPCAQEFVEVAGSMGEEGVELGVAWAFPGTEPELGSCDFDGAAIVVSPEGSAETQLSCVDGVLPGDLDRDGRGELVILEVDCAGGGAGEIYPQFWADRPGGPVALHLALGAAGGGVVDVEWRSEGATNDTLVVVVSDAADDWERDESLDREISVRVEGTQLVPVR